MKAMKTIIATILAAASLSISSGYTIDRGHTAAEEDFISACREKSDDCYADAVTDCCFPEVVIFDQQGNLFAKGDHHNAVIINLIATADFLTDVQGTAYFRLSALPGSEEPNILVRE
jgi:hypothetical protein